MSKLDNSVIAAASTADVTRRTRGIGVSFRNFLRAATRRHTTLSTLLEADPHVLKDMGLTPQDVQSASASRWWEDPTDQLARLAQERR